MPTHLADREVSIRRMGTFRRARRLCAIVLLSVAASCSAWLPVPGAGLAPAQAERVHHARVILRDGTVVELDYVTITPDSIIGLGDTIPGRWAVTRAEVEAVETRRADSTTSFIAGSLAVFAGLFLLFRAGGL